MSDFFSHQILGKRRSRRGGTVGSWKFCVRWLWFSRKKISRANTSPIYRNNRHIWMFFRQMVSCFVYKDFTLWFYDIFNRMKLLTYVCNSLFVSVFRRLPKFLRYSKSIRAAYYARIVRKLRRRLDEYFLLLIFFLFFSIVDGLFCFDNWSCVMLPVVLTWKVPHLTS